MDRSLMTSQEVSRLGEELYTREIRKKVESKENIGRIVTMDIETGEYEVDDVGIESARKLHARHPKAALYGKRIGYNVVTSFGRVMERTAT